MTLAQRYHDGDVARISYKLAALSTAEQMIEDTQGVERLLIIADFEEENRAGFGARGE